MRWLDCIPDSMDMNLSKLQELVKDTEACHAAAHGVSGVRHEQMNKKNFFNTRKPIVRNKIALSTSINDRCRLLFCPWVILYICMLLTIVDKYVYLNVKLLKSPFSCILIKNPDFKFYLSCWVRKQQDWFSLWSNLTERTVKKCPESVLFGNTKKRNLSLHVFKNNFQLSLIWNQGLS